MTNNIPAFPVTGRGTTFAEALASAGGVARTVLGTHPFDYRLKSVDVETSWNRGMGHDAPLLPSTTTFVTITVIPEGDQ